MAQKPILTGDAINLAARAVQAVLEGLLEETGTSFHEWVTLNAVAASGGSIEQHVLEARLHDSLKRDADAIDEAIAHLVNEGHLRRVPGAEAALEVTPSGSALHDRIRSGSGEIAARLYEGIPVEDLAATARVLATVRERANADLAASV
jgi:hypothetical protein